MELTLVVFIKCVDDYIKQICINDVNLKRENIFKHLFNPENIFAFCTSFFFHDLNAIILLLRVRQNDSQCL